MMQTDLIVIGAGPGGYRAAEYAARQGLKVVVAERNEVGGTCLNRGCIPTKTYIHSASFAEAVERQLLVVQQLRNGVEQILSHPNITLLRGEARFESPQSVSVCSDTVTAPHIIIATGSTVKMLSLPDIDDKRVVDSTGLLQLATQPKRLCIIGAGVIGMEFASVFNRFGSEVMVIEYLKECLPMLDSDIAKRLRKSLEKRGIIFKMKTAVQRLADIDADVILMATGRKPCTDGLNLEAAGIQLAPDGSILVNDDMQVMSPSTGIYAIGDVNGRQMLAHAAEMQAVHAVNHILDRKDTICLDIMPAAIFTSPEAACVGLSEDRLKAQGMPFECRKAFHRANGKALTMGETEGMLKLFSEPDAGRILGCHVYGAHAADMVQEVSALMCCQATVRQLRYMVHIHPTLSELVLMAAES
jgi:dihydrolipoamide dehydrogenase